MCSPVFRLEEIVSNTRAYQSSLDVPSPPSRLTITVKGLLRPTQIRPSYPTHQVTPPSPLKSIEGIRF